MLLLDGHALHISIDVIKLARVNDIHMLRVSTHIHMYMYTYYNVLQPLDVGSSSLVRHSTTKPARNTYIYISDRPGRGITTNLIAFLLAAARQSVTPIRIMAGFKQSKSLALALALAQS